jgi:hypothetical protein
MLAHPVFVDNSGETSLHSGQQLLPEMLHLLDQVAIEANRVARIHPFQDTSDFLVFFLALRQ